MSSAIRTTDCRSVASTRTSTAGMPLTRETTSSSTKASRILATSPSVTMLPSSRVRSGMLANSSPMLRLPTVCSTTPPDSVRSSPNVRFKETRWTVLATWAIERPLRRSASSLSSIEISRSRVPRSLTWEIDGNSSNSRRTCSAASLSLSSPASDEDTARVMTSISRR